MKFTVFGANGFIGSHLVDYLNRNGHEVRACGRDSDIVGASLGHVIYAIGLTANFRNHPHETIEAHVGVLSRLLQTCQFESWLYLSSTRLYAGLSDGDAAKESALIPITPSADSLYDLSKLLGESLCLTLPSANVRVARLSNVYGLGQSQSTFLASVLRDLSSIGSVLINESPTSCKDYVDIDDVVPLLVDIACRGQLRMYNVACGRSTSHAELARELNVQTGVIVRFSEGAPQRIFPTIDITAARSEFNYVPAMLSERLAELLDFYPPLSKHGVSL